MFWKSFPLLGYLREKYVLTQGMSPELLTTIPIVYIDNKCVVILESLYRCKFNNDTKTEILFTKII